MAQLSNFNLVQDGFVDGIYHFLWQKIAQKSCPNVSIPDTVVYKYRQPAYWYFMSVDGSIKMKAQKNIVNAKIFEAFSKQSKDAVTDIVAYYISPVEGPNGNTDKTTIEFFDVEGLWKFLFHRSKTDTGIIQKYVESKGDKNCVIRAIWTPNLCLMERRVNNLRITDQKADMYERAVTYEGATHHSESLPINGTVLPAAVQTVCASMVDHFCEADLRISRMVLHMKQDANDKLWLTWCSSMRLQDVPERVNPVNLAPFFRERGFTKEDAKIECPWDGKRYDGKLMCKLPYYTIVKVAQMQAELEAVEKGEVDAVHRVPNILKRCHKGLTDDKYQKLRHNAIFLYREAFVSEDIFLYYTRLASKLEEQGAGSVMLSTTSSLSHSRAPSALGGSAHSTPGRSMLNATSTSMASIASAGSEGGAASTSTVLHGRPSSSMHILAGHADLVEGERGVPPSGGVSRTRSALDDSLGIMRPEELPGDVWDRLHINASTSFILKNSEKAAADDTMPFY